MSTNTVLRGLWSWREPDGSLMRAELESIEQQTPVDPVYFNILVYESEYRGIPHLISRTAALAKVRIRLSYEERQALMDFETMIVRRALKAAGYGIDEKEAS